jgi:hypothetical protein
MIVHRVPSFDFTDGICRGALDTANGHHLKKKKKKKECDRIRTRVVAPKGVPTAMAKSTGSERAIDPQILAMDGWMKCD